MNFSLLDRKFQPPEPARRRKQMPLYDCGEPDCDECKRAFGPDRSEAVARYQHRSEQYARLERSAAPEAPHDVIQDAYAAGVRAAAQVAAEHDNCGTDSDLRHFIPHEITRAIEALVS